MSFFCIFGTERFFVKDPLRELTHARLLCFVGVLRAAPPMTTFKRMQICVYIRLVDAKAKRSELQAAKLLSQTPSRMQ